MASGLVRSFTGIAVAAVIGAAGWIAIGPDWRALLRYPPLDSNVLFWSVEQRDATFRMFDALPFLHEFATVERGDAVRPLPDGAPLDVDVDLDAFMADQRASALLILHDGKIRMERYGLGFGRGKRWTSFSVAKSLTSTLVGAALQDGFIKSLDDAVSKYVSGLEGSPYDDVTVRQLLTMTSGVGWNEDYYDPGSDVARFDQIEPVEGERSIVTYMKTLQRAHPPGTVWNYSTGETNLIGVLVAQATGKSIAQYMSEKVWAPYGMESRATWMFGADGAEMSGCCFQATTRDFARFGQFILDGGRIGGEAVAPADYLAAATRRQAATDRMGRDGYGYQWWIAEDDAFMASGIFGQTIFIDPARSLVVAMNANWTTALGDRDGEALARLRFLDAAQAAIDAEAGRVAS
ncbi:MAG: serine hydrolase domain-containing protein [Pseudomonadota bacterium]